MGKEQEGKKRKKKLSADVLLKSQISRHTDPASHYLSSPTPSVKKKKKKDKEKEKRGAAQHRTKLTTKTHDC